MKSFRLSHRDHPRIRGEHNTMTALKQHGLGSSPHTRGALVHVLIALVVQGIIPAYAGSTSPRTPRGSGPWDHPRIRGEHPIAWTSRRSTAGSSPHTRGAPVRHIGRDLVAGIIPAYAGSTIRIAGAFRPCRDHPRIRGEHSSVMRMGLGHKGSSPHTRGARQPLMSMNLIIGIIPAYAGSTSSMLGC